MMKFNGQLYNILLEKFFYKYQANYGGKVTDSNDRFLLLKILNNYLNPHILEHNYKFSESGTYGFPDILNLSNFKDYIKRLPINTEPELFGLHQNAEISAQIKASNNFCDQVLSILPR